MLEVLELTTEEFLDFPYLSIVFSANFHVNNRERFRIPTAYFPMREQSGHQFNLLILLQEESVQVVFNRAANISASE